MLKRLILVLCLVGCNSQPKQDDNYTSSEPKHSTPELKRMELDLLINLWLHTHSEVKRLNLYLERSDLTQEQREAALITLGMVQQQSKETWLAIFKE